MQQAQLRESNPNTSLASTAKLPDDILYFVAELSPFKTRASLVQCNKLLHATCMPLLFRDIYIYTPTKLVQLYENTKSIHMLSGTKSLLLGEALFYQERWELLEHNKSEYILLVLSATLSLLRLQLVSTEYPMSGSDRDHVPCLVQRLRSLSLDAMFLPKLRIVAGAKGIPLDFLCNNRPVAYLSCIKRDGMFVEIRPGHSALPSSSPSPSSTHSRLAYDLCPGEIGLLIRESKGTNLIESPFIHFTIRPSGEPGYQKNLPIARDIFSWIEEMALAADFKSDCLVSLSLTLDPNPSFMSAREQLRLVEDLHKLLPTLEKAIMANPPISWYRTPEPVYLAGNSPRSFYAPEILPKWTPAPDSDDTDPEVIGWWLDLLLLNKPDTPGYDRREAQQNARRLRDAMRLRWNESIIPQEWWLKDYLRGGGE